MQTETNKRTYRLLLKAHAGKFALLIYEGGNCNFRYCPSLITVVPPEKRRSLNTRKQLHRGHDALTVLMALLSRVTAELRIRP